MNIKSIAALGLVAVALAVTSITPAEAHHHNNKYLDQLAMQMYMQNQGLAANTGAYGGYGGYNPLMTANYMSNPWSAGAIPGYTTVASPVSAVAVPYNTAVNPYACTGAYNTAAYGNIVSPQYSGLRPQLANWRARLGANNLSGWQASRLQNQISGLRSQPSGVALTGYGSPTAPRSGIVNNLRSAMRI